MSKVVEVAGLGVIFGIVESMRRAFGFGLELWNGGRGRKSWLDRCWAENVF